MIYRQRQQLVLKSTVLMQIDGEKCFIAKSTHRISVPCPDAPRRVEIGVIFHEIAAQTSGTLRMTTKLRRRPLGAAARIQY